MAQNGCYVILVCKDGKEEHITEEEARDMLDDRTAGYGGRMRGKECVVQVGAYQWRKTVQRGYGGVKVGMAGMELVRV